MHGFRHALFRDRVDAGRQLADRLARELQKRPELPTVVIARPRGGVPVAYEVAEKLNVPLDIVAPRKIGAPHYEEFAIGAVTEDKQHYIDETTVRRLQVPPSYINEQIDKQAAEAQRRLKVYREGRPPLNLSDKRAIIIDDGIATGATMRAAIRSVKSKGAREIIVAVPLAPTDSLQALPLVDDTIALATPEPFTAVGAWYGSFPQTEDSEVTSLMERSKGFGTTQQAFKPAAGQASYVPDTTTTAKIR